LYEVREGLVGPFSVFAHNVCRLQVANRR
jgi:hypothetical protein